MAGQGRKAICADDPAIRAFIVSPPDEVIQVEA
jgi:hypothetical protein